MPSQQDISTTLLNASAKRANLALMNYNLVQSGHLPIQQDYIRYFNLNLVALTYQYDNALYITSTTVTLYNRLNQLIGLPINVTINPNAQNPNTTIIVEGGSTGQVIEFMIPAGTPIPFNYGYSLSEQPDVSFYIDNGSGILTTNGATNITNNLSGGIMSIYGNENGSGGFNEDTYVRIEV